jgi:hypothetical protein
MTNQAKPVPHIHAEVLRAIADGKTVQYQYKRTNEWLEGCTHPSQPDPFTNPDLQWRVKPEVKPDIKARGHFYCDPNMPNDWNFVFTADVDNVQFTFCGETHKLIKVELIEEGNE